MAANPLGFYGLNLQTEPEIDKLSTDQLVAVLSIVADKIYDQYEYTRLEIVPSDIFLEALELPTLASLSLIRCMCDRIELKLMEASK